MIETHERKSLRIIFDRVRPDNITGFMESLLETYKSQYKDDFTAILETAVISMKTAEKTTFIN